MGADGVKDLDSSVRFVELNAVSAFTPLKIVLKNGNILEPGVIHHTNQSTFTPCFAHVTGDAMNARWKR